MSHKLKKCFRVLIDDLKAQVASAEESRDRLHQSHRELELSVDPMRRELDQAKNTLIKMKEDRVVEVTDLKARIQAKMDELTRANAELAAFKGMIENWDFCDL